MRRQGGGRGRRQEGGRGEAGGRRRRIGRIALYTHTHTHPHPHSPTLTRHPPALPRLPAADLLALLARREAVVSELLAASGLGRLVGQLAPGVDGQLAHSLLRVLCYVAADAGAVAEMYHVRAGPGGGWGGEGA